MRATKLVNDLVSLEDAARIIESGAVLTVAGSESLLRKLPAGNWIGGTMRYFVTTDGGSQSTDRLFVTELGVDPAAVTIRSYDAGELPQVGMDAPDNGFSLLIIPSGSPAMLEYARRAPYYAGLFRTPIVGWVAGVSFGDLGRVAPRVFDGLRGQRETSRAVALHARLPRTQLARIDIVNMFRPGPGPVITFPEDALSASECFVNGRATNLARHLSETRADTRLPLVADYAGALVNTSFQSVDAEAGLVTFYAPVFRNIAYRLAAPVADYGRAFQAAVEAADLEPRFTCGCILNYVYGDLEGRPVGGLAGPMTFGEIAYQLLNQTVVCLSVENA